MRLYHTLARLYDHVSAADKRHTELKPFCEDHYLRQHLLQVVGSDAMVVLLDRQDADAAEIDRRRG